MYTYRNHLGNIYFEFLKHPTSQKCFIICEGIINSNPSKIELMNALYSRWYSSIVPRYEGTRESKGEFLKHSPHQDIMQIIQHFQTTPIQGVYNRQNLDFREEEMVLLGANLGGNIVLKIAAEWEMRTIALSPVIFSKKHYTQYTQDNIIFLGRYLKEGYGAAYRFSDKNWEQLAKGKILSLQMEKLQEKNKKILIISDRDDIYIKQEPIDELCRITGIAHQNVENYGPLAMRKVDEKILDIIEEFLH